MCRMLADYCPSAQALDNVLRTVPFRKQVSAYLFKATRGQETASHALACIWGMDYFAPAMDARLSTFGMLYFKISV